MGTKRHDVMTFRYAFCQHCFRGLDLTHHHSTGRPTVRANGGVQTPAIRNSGVGIGRAPVEKAATRDQHDPAEKRGEGEEFGAEGI